MKADSGGAREARRAVRRTAMAASTLRAAGVPATDVTVIDLSVSGIRIAATAALAVGDEISIGLAGVGVRRAYVAWRRNGEYGCAFDQPLEAAEVADAFMSASVVRLGTPAELTQAVASAPGIDMRELYGAKPAWHLPFDAVLAILIYAGALAWGAWHLLP